MNRTLRITRHGATAARCLGRCVRLATFAWVWLALSVLAQAAEHEPGQTYFGKNQWVEYLAGDSPVVISVPHGGRERPSEIPDRTEGTFAFDVNTQELGRAIAAEFFARTGRYPHVVLCRLHRIKVDCNREITVAAAGNPSAVAAWHEYHEFLATAQRAVVARHARGFFLDLHGHGHTAQRLEIGYLFSAEQLRLPDEELNQPRFAAESSLRLLAVAGQSSHADLLRGPLSFGSLMEQQGFSSVPSVTTPHPPAPYFRGGYNLGRYTRDAAGFFGLQIETNSQGVRDTKASRAAFAAALVRSLQTYFEVHLGLKLGATAPPKLPEEKLPAATEQRQRSPRDRIRTWRRGRC